MYPPPLKEVRNLFDKNGILFAFLNDIVIYISAVIIKVLTTQMYQRENVLETDRETGRLMMRVAANSWIVASQDTSYSSFR